MQEKILNEVHMETSGLLSDAQWEKLQEILLSCLRKYKIEPLSEKSYVQDNKDYLKLYISAKKVEGCSEKTLLYYESTIEKLLLSLEKDIRNVTTAELRVFLADYQQTRQISKITVDNIRRILSGFFGWLEDEDYIVKSPARRIHKIKTAQIIKETFTDENLEALKDSCTNKRDLALVSFLSSTGVRVGEIIHLDKKDINFIERSCIVFGKGAKEREVYFDAATKLHLQAYLNSRQDTNDALFVSRNSPHNRLSISAITKMLKKLGQEAQISKVHPHKFRRTLATIAIDKGMPVEQVQKLLGHVRIDTTMHYAMVSQTNVKNAHRKYIG